MANKKISQLTAASALTGTEELPIVQSGQTVKTTAQDIADLAGGGSYLKYVALLSQSGEDAPIATVLENTLGGTPVWTRIAVGVYRLTLTDAFPTDKTIIFTSLTEENNIGLVFTETQTGSFVRVRTSNLSGSSIDEVLSNTSIEIRVYP
jgi:hypothetical protein